MSRLKWLLDRIGDIILDVVAGYLLYLIVGGYISQPLANIYPYLPTLLEVSLTLAIVIGLLYRLFKSVRHHRFIERTSQNLSQFLKKWDELYNAFNKAMNSQGSGNARKEFEDVRTSMQYEYPKIASAVKVVKYSYIDRLVGISVENYDAIGNLLGRSPFIAGQWHMQEDFEKSWDVGRTILVATIGYFDAHRDRLAHRLLWLFHLVPLPTKSA